MAEIGKWGSGGTPKSGEPLFYDGSIPWIRSGDLTDREIRKHVVSITEDGLAASSAKWVPTNSVLIAMYGATIGRVGLTTYPVTTNQAVAFCIPKQNAVEPRYLLSYLLSIRDFLISCGQGGAQPNISQEIIKRLDFPVAPLPEQRRIVAKLDALDASSKRARADLDRIPALVARAKQAILAKAFETVPDTKRIGEFVSRIEAGKNLRCIERPPEAHERGVVKVSAVTWGEFDPSASKTLPDDFEPPEHTLIRPGDFLFSRANTLELVGACVIVVEAPSNLFLSDKILRLILPDDLKPWLKWFLRSPRGRAALEEASSGNQMSMRNIGQKALLDIPAPFAPADIRKQIVYLIESAFQKIDRMAAEAASASKLLDRLDQALLAKAFRGELVPQNPEDEPAEKLLARITAARGAAPKTTRRRKTRG